jgi:hypothetical protein
MWVLEDCKCDTYDNEHIQVSTRTVCENPFKFRICDRHESRQTLQLSNASGPSIVKSPLPDGLLLSCHMR